MFASSSTSANGVPAALEADSRRTHAPAAEHLLKNPAVDHVVVDDQHGHVSEDWRHAALRRNLRQAHLDHDVERGSRARRAVHPDSAAHHLREPRRNRKAQARAAEPPRGRPVCLVEGLEDRRLLLERDADAGIGDVQLKADLAVTGGHCVEIDEDVPLGRELHGVVDEVAENLPHANGIARHALRHAI
jgi:hypothetical protein